MATTLKPSTGQRIKELRLARGWSLDNLASRVNAARADTWRWENREREPSNIKLILLADAFQVSTDYLLGRTDDPRTLEQFKADLIHYVQT